MKKILSALLASLLVTLVYSITPALAHVVVKPNQVGVGAYQTFTISVPNERDDPTIALRLVLPDGLKATPTVKPDWNITTKDNEISWTGGSIPAGQRDDFTFSTQAPSSPTTLTWKAYQTYSDGSIVAWDQDPKAAHAEDTEEEEHAGPYSETKVIDDLSATSQQPTQDNTKTIAIAALALAALSIAFQFRSK